MRSGNLLCKASKTGFQSYHLGCVLSLHAERHRREQQRQRDRSLQRPRSLRCQLNCSFVLVHHASKGNQSVKSVTDVGAGAGSQSRATDTHLVLRHHQEPGCVVVDAAVRSWPPIEPQCLRWSFPVWYTRRLTGTKGSEERISADAEPNRSRRRRSHPRKNGPPKSSRSSLFVKNRSA